MNKIYLGNCIEMMPELPEESVDLIITDPPFGIGLKDKKANYNRTASNVIPGYTEVGQEDYYDFTEQWMRQAYRVLKESGSMYCFSGFNNLKDVLTALDELGFITINHLIWKYPFGVYTSRKYVTSHWHLLYACKDDKQRKFFPYARFDQATVTDGKKAHYIDKEDVWVINREYWRGKMKTPTKLPREIIEKILAYSSHPGDVVLDPFMGSGQVPLVSYLNGRKYIGYEIVPEYYEFAKKRLENGG